MGSYFFLYFYIFGIAYIISVTKSQFLRSGRFVWHPSYHYLYVITVICQLCQFMTCDRCQTEVVYMAIWVSNEASEHQKYRFCHRNDVSYSKNIDCKLFNKSKWKLEDICPPSFFDPSVLWRVSLASQQMLAFQSLC